jgi:hypothetical protein
MAANEDLATDKALSGLIEQLLVTTDSLGEIVDHMTAFHAAGYSSPDAPPVEIVLSGLLTEMLEPLLERHGRGQLKAAARVLDEAGELICSELYLVDAEALESDGPDSKGDTG